LPSVTLSVYETCMRGELLIPVELWLVFKLSNAKVVERDMRQIKKNILAIIENKIIVFVFSIQSLETRSI